MDDHLPGGRGEPDDRDGCSTVPKIPAFVAGQARKSLEATGVVHPVDHTRAVMCRLIPVEPGESRTRPGATGRSSPLFHPG